MSVLCGTLMATSPEKIRLNKPNLNRGANFMQTLSQRESVRTFKPDALSLADLSDLLWAANGVNRENGKRTAPSARNKQEITVYAFLPTGVYRYDAKAHTLIRVVEGDHRKLLNGGQDFADKGALCLLHVGDASKFADHDAQMQREMVAIDAGIVCQNVNLFCAAMGLSNVPRKWMDVEGVCKLLKLPAHEIPMLNNVIGYKK